MRGSFDKESGVLIVRVTASDLVMDKPALKKRFRQMLALWEPESIRLVVHSEGTMQ